MFKDITIGSYESDITQMLMYFIMLGIIFTLPIILINNSIKYQMGEGKNKDVLKRRIYFFLGLIILFVLVVLPNFGIFDSFQNQMESVITNESHKVIILDEIKNAFAMCLIYSLGAYLGLYIIVAFIATKFKQYKQMTVFKSNNKIFGLI